MSSDNSLQSKSKTDFGNELSEIDFAQRLLFEFGLDNSDGMEIDRTITKIKVDMFQDNMEKFYDPDMCPYFPLKNK